ncbi:MAG: Gfo/Idh/MocA family oxidoreductase [Armatimonadota bacterium]|nr:Gfo/Idh/MocA family oxidoreductase [Armatimonadota bacterium]
MNIGKDKGLTRREFLKAAGVTAAGVMVGSLASSPVFSVAPMRALGANDRIKVGFIGVGGQGLRHVQAVKSMADSMNVETVAVCDIWDKRAQIAAKEAGCPSQKIYHDYRAMLEDKDVDVVLIGTPEHWHAKIATDALESGRHCYIEKPVTRTLAEALKLQETVKRTKGVVQVGSQGCSSAVWHRAHDLIKEGRIGKIVWSQGSYCRNSTTGEWNYPIDPEANGQSVDWKTWLGSCKQRPWDPERYFRWRKFTDYSSGIISDLFPHRLHPLMLALGAEYPTKVACIGTIVMQPPDREVADNTQLLVEFSNGSTMVIVGATCSEMGIDDVIRGNKASINFSGNKIEIKPDRPYVEEVDLFSETVKGPQGSMGDHWKDFFEAIRTGKTPNCNIDLATKVQTIVSLAEMSWRKGKMMQFDPVNLKVI